MPIALERALERVRAGDWTARRLPAIAIHPVDAQDEWALNDFVVLRHGAGQVVVNLFVDDELYVRLAGDGLIVASPLGSSAYSMAAGGPVLASGMPALVCTPLAMHGGSAPPLVVPAGTDVRVEVHPSFAGFDIEIDGHGIRWRLSTTACPYTTRRSRWCRSASSALGYRACASGGSSPTARACWRATIARDPLGRSLVCHPPSPYPSW